MFMTDLLTSEMKPLRGVTIFGRPKYLRPVRKYNIDYLVGYWRENVRNRDFAPKSQGKLEASLGTSSLRGEELQMLERL